MINACIDNAYSIWRIIWLQPGMFDRNQTPLHLFLVPIDSSPSTTAGKHSHQLRYIIVFIPTLNLGSGLVRRVDLQVSRLSPQCEFWPGWDIVNGLVANVLTPRHCFGVILGSSWCLLPALDHLEVFPWRSTQTVMQYQMWVDLLYVTYYNPFDVYIAILNHSPHHPPPKNLPYSKNGQGGLLDPTTSVCTLSLASPPSH